VAGSRCGSVEECEKINPKTKRPQVRFQAQANLKKVVTIWADLIPFFELNLIVFKLEISED
jgi:hypothetical protein